MRKELSDKCLDPVGQMFFQGEAMEAHKLSAKRYKPEILLTDEMLGGYGQIMGEIYCLRNCKKQEDCFEGVRIQRMYDMTSMPGVRG